MKRTGRSKVLCLFALLCVAIASVVLFLSRWVMETWKNLTMDELMFQIHAPTEGTASGIVWSGIWKAGVPALLLFLLFAGFYHLMRKKKVYPYLLCAGIVTSLLVTTISTYAFCDTLHVKEYISYQSNPSTFIEENYVDPKDVTLTFPNQKRNLIFLFLESMEVTYADEESGGGFVQNVIPELTAIAQENEDFSGNTTKLNGAYSLPYTTFTMGGMFAQTSGLPLKNNLENNDMVTQSQFFSDTTCLGDILQEEGYRNVFLLGSNATFGGRRLYYTQHGAYEIYDYNYAKDHGWIAEDYKVWWGLEDAKLFSYAQTTLNAISEQEQPFALTILTVDTHFEDGYRCEDCPDTFGENRYANVMACFSAKVAQFLDWCKEQDWYANTTIVLCGDHPTMDSNFCNDVDSSYQRRAYVSYINSAVTTESSLYRTYSTLDAFPTTLAAMGVTIEGNRLGLGTNLFSSEETLLERYGISTVTKEIYKKSVFMDALANIDFTNEQLRKRQAYSLKEDHGKTVYDENAD